MFRRRGQRMQRGVPQVPPRLQRANQFMASGDYENAEIAFLELAQGAVTRFPNRAPILFMEAGQAAIMNGKTQTGLKHINLGLGLLRTQGRLPRMMMLGQRAVQELQARGLAAEASKISELIYGQNKAPNITPDLPQKKPILPTHCPSCGGAIRPNEIEWLDEITAECDYCGSPLREEA